MGGNIIEMAGTENLRWNDTCNLFRYLKHIPADVLLPTRQATNTSFCTDAQCPTSSLQEDEQAKHQLVAEAASEPRACGGRAGLERRRRRR
jgi:hypothetical protein